MTADQAVEQRLAHEVRRWKWLRFLTRSATVGIAVACIALLLGLALHLGWVRTWNALVFALAVLAGGGCVAWLAAAWTSARSRLGRPRLAQAIERACPSLLDRLNALAFLEGRRDDPHVAGLYRRIEGQAGAVLADERPPSPFSVVPAATSLAVFGLLAAAVVLLYLRLHPLEALRPPPPNAASVELPVADEESAGEDKTAIEVRITEPGRDVTVTRVETVPLRIEAAAFEPLERVEWYTSVNGGEEERRELPAPTEPHRAVYQPSIDVQGLGLKDWDVLAYYARAIAEGGSSAVSDVYFVHVQPFQEELEKLPDGEHGERYDLLNELTNLIHQQESVVREAHRERHSPEDTPERRRATPEELAQRERELADAACHSGARASAEVGEERAETATSHLADAESALQDAAQAFDEGATAGAEREARKALAELAAARAELGKCMSTAPGEAADQDAPEAAPDPEKALAEMSESREKAEGLCNSARELAEKQQQLADQARQQPPASYPRLAETQEKLRQELARLQKANPGACRQAQKECSGASQAMEAASQALRQGSSQAPQRAREAGEKLDDLAKALGKQARDEQLGNAYRLKRMLDEQRQQLEKAAESAEAPEREALEECAKNVKEATSQLKRAAEKPPTSQCFGPQLRESLSDEKKRDLDSECESMCNKPGSRASRQAARQMAERLSEIGQAVSQSRPQGLAQQRNALRPDGEEAMERGMRQAQRLAESERRGQRESALSREDRDRLRREASRNLERATTDQQRPDSGTSHVGSALRRELENETPSGSVDEAVIRQLISQLEALRVERARSADEQEDEEWDIEHIDPSRLPPAYRERIQRYYEKLSEQQ